MMVLVLAPVAGGKGRGRDGPASGVSGDPMGGLATLSEDRCLAAELGEECEEWEPTTRLRMGKVGVVGMEGETKVAMAVVREELGRGVVWAWVMRVCFCLCLGLFLLA